MSRGAAKAASMALLVISLNVTRRCLRSGISDGLGDVPGDGLALAVEVRGEVHEVRRCGRPTDGVELLATVLVDDVLGREVVLDVDAQLALAGVLGEVADMTVGGQDLVAVAQVSLDRPRLGGRLDDHQVLGHGAASVAPVRRRTTFSAAPVDQASRMRRSSSASGSRCSMASSSERASAGSSIGGGVMMTWTSSGTLSASAGSWAGRGRQVHAQAGLVDRVARDLDEADDVVGDEEDRVEELRGQRLAALQRAQVGAQEAGVRGGGQRLDVRLQGQLAVEVQDDVADHAAILRCRGESLVAALDAVYHLRRPHGAGPEGAALPAGGVRRARAPSRAAGGGSARQPPRPVARPLARTSASTVRGPARSDSATARSRACQQLAGRTRRRADLGDDRVPRARLAGQAEVDEHLVETHQRTCRRLAQQGQVAGHGGIERPAGNDQELASLLEGVPGGDEGAAARWSLDDDGGRCEGADDPVASRIGAPRRPARRAPAR